MTLPPEPPEADIPLAIPVEPLVEPLEEVVPAPAKPPGPHLGWALLWCLLFMFVSQFVIGVPLGIFALVLAIGEQGYDNFRADPRAFIETAFHSPLIQSVILLGGSWGNLLVASGFVVVAHGRHVLSRLAIRGIHPFHILLILLLIVPQYFVLIKIHELVEPLVPKLGLLESLSKAVDVVPWIVTLIAASLVPGIGEELFCRGFLGRGLVARHGVVLGVAAASFLFGAIHLEPAQAAYAIVMGVSLHLVYLWCKSLTAAMLLHAGNNAVALLLHALSGNPPEVPKEAVGTPEASWPWLIPITALLATVAVLILLRFARTEWRLADGSIWSPGYSTAELPPPDAAAKPIIQHPPRWALMLMAFSLLAFAVCVVYELKFR